MLAEGKKIAGVIPGRYLCSGIAPRLWGDETLSNEEAHHGVLIFLKITIHFKN
jgi:hypothetical protein